MELYLMFTICSRRRLKEFLDFYKENKIEIGNISYGKGTAAFEILDYLGLEDDEKTIHTTIVTDNSWLKLKKGLEKEIRIDVPGVGICFTVPLSSFGGKRELCYLLDGQEFDKGEEKIMEKTKYELIVAISNYGYNTQVINAAKLAGARGGTLLHGKGIGLKEAQRFLGVSLVSEKEIILIVTSREDKNKIMSSIMENVGIKSEAGTVCFSLPVDDVAGFKLHDEKVG